MSSTNNNNALRVSPPRLDAEFAGDSTKYKKYEAQLRSIDKNGDGVIDMNELCDLIDEMAQIEKQRRLLKWAAIITGIFALLTIAATVGLVYAVVVLTKDTNVSSSGVLTTNDAAASPIATGQAMNYDSVNNLYTKSLDDLSSLSFLTIPSATGGRVVHVAEVDLVANTSVTITTDAGTKYVIDASGIHEAMSNGRRLLIDVSPTGNPQAKAGLVSGATSQEKSGDQSSPTPTPAPSSSSPAPSTPSPPSPEPTNDKPVSNPSPSAPSSPDPPSTPSPQNEKKPEASPSPSTPSTPSPQNEKKSEASPSPSTPSTPSPQNSNKQIDPSPSPSTPSTPSPQNSNKQDPSPSPSPSAPVTQSPQQSSISPSSPSPSPSSCPPPNPPKVCLLGLKSDCDASCNPLENTGPYYECVNYCLRCIKKCTGGRTYWGRYGPF